MEVLQTVARWNARADDWLLARPVASFVAFAVPPGLAIAAFEVIRGGHVLDGLVLGAVFGITFASVSVFLRRRRS